MLTKPPTPAKRCAELRDVDVAFAIDLDRSERGEVQSATVVEIELRRLIDDGVRIRRGAEAQPAGGHAADRTALDGQRERCSSPRSAAMRATPSGMPMPRFATAPSGSSSHARRR